MDLKINLIEEEKCMVLYSVTLSKKIHALDIQLLPTLKMTKELSEFTADELLYKVEFFDFSKFVMACAASRKVVIASYNEDTIPNRVINVGYDMIGSIFFLRAKFFGITHPQKKIVGFYELDEKECATKVIKRCSPFDLTQAV